MGGTSGIAEMLLQSHEDIIHILPALPDERAGGKVTGLRARGIFTVDIAWQNGVFTESTVRGTPGAKVKIMTDDRVSGCSIPDSGVLSVNHKVLAKKEMSEPIRRIRHLYLHIWHAAR